MGSDVQRIEGGALHAQHHAIKIGDHSVGVEILTIVELYALAKVERPLGAILAHLPTLCQTGNGRGGIILRDERFPDVENLAAVVAILLTGRQVAVAGKHNFSIGILRRLGNRKAAQRAQRQQQHQDQGK